MNRLKLLVEEPVFDYDILIEEKNANEPGTLFIQGPYLMAEQKNKNGRIYTLNEMIGEVSRYKTEMIMEKRALGELNHPASVEVNPERACHLVTELRQDGNVFIGKSKVLSNPIGQIVRSLIMDGVKLGISSRALGKLVPGAGDTHMVSGFHLICADVVHDPSVNAGKGGPQAFINGIMESREWILGHNGEILEAYEAFDQKIANLPRNSVLKEEVLKEAVIKFISSLRN